MDELRTLLRGALRLFRTDRLYAIVSLATIALGIGANVAIFSVINGVLLRPLPYKDPDRLVVVREVVPKLSHVSPTMPAGALDFLEWRGHATAFEQIAALRPLPLTLTGQGEPEELGAVAASASLLPMLGVDLAFGRHFLPEEEQDGRDHVVIISDGLWRRRFQGDPGLVGRPIMIDGQPSTVVGILPPSFRFPQGKQLGALVTLRPRTDIFKPLVFGRQDLIMLGGFNFAVIGRLRPGMTLDRALAELNGIQAELAARLPEKVELRAALWPLQERIVGDVRRGLWVLMAAVAAVLLIVCVNLANVSLVRSVKRMHEAAIRTAMGASRAQLVRQAFGEGLMLALLGGALGVLVAFWSLRALVLAAPADLPRVDNVRLDGYSLAFALVCSLATGVLFALLPAWRFSRMAPIEGLSVSGGRTTEGRWGLRLRETLVVVETALSVVLLILAGLLVTSFVRLMTVERGFDSSQLLVANVTLPATSYRDAERRGRFYDEVMTNVRAIPGVSTVAATSSLPTEIDPWVDAIMRPDDTASTLERPRANVWFVSPDYFRTLRSTIVRGRAFEERDRGREVAVISQRVAERLWPRQDPIGQVFYRGSTDAPLVEVVGVAADVRANLLDEPGLLVYAPIWKRPPSRALIVLRTGTAPVGLASVVRTAIWKVDPGVPIPQIRTMDEVVTASVAQRQFQMRLALVFALAALLLATIGIYGVVSYSVVQRASEMGIRIALGAEPSSLRRMVVRRGMTPAVIGTAAGIVVAVALGRLVQSLVFGVDPHNVATYAGVAAILIAVAAIASYLPARRATRFDPATVLKAQ